MNYSALQSKNDALEHARAAADCFGLDVGAIERCSGGANSGVFRLETNRGAFALKRYVADGNAYPRLAREYAALSFLSSHGCASWIPLPIAADMQHGYALYQWIDGVKLTSHGERDVEAALAFFGVLDRLATDPDAAELGDAVEAAHSLDALLEGLDCRVLALQGVPGEPALASFLQDLFLPEYRRRRDEALADFDRGRALERAFTTLSPSDVSFHNMLRRPDGTLAYLDFEYFGFDDPAKLCSDFLWHPAHTLSRTERARFIALALALWQRDPGFPRRFVRVFPLFGLKWSLIVLNEFLPATWERRRLAGIDEDRDAVLKRQLARAQHFAEAVSGQRFDLEVAVR